MGRDRSAQAGTERTEEERTRAREERERRRAARQGIEQPPQPPLPPPAPAYAQTETPPEAALQADPVQPQAVQAEALLNPPQVEPAPEPSQAEAVLDPPQAYVVDADIDAVPERQAARTGGVRRLHRPHVSRPHLHRPHLPRRPSRARRGAARAAAIIALTLVFTLIAGVGLYFLRRAVRSVPPGPKILSVVVPEGYTAAQVAKLAREDGLRGSYPEALSQAERAGLLRPSLYRAPAGTHSLEGFLFPATYELYAGSSASRLIEEQLAAFHRRFGAHELAAAHNLGVTPYQLLIVASIVEREASRSRERPLVAAVVYNRLRLGMTLGIDATLRYALHDFTRPLTEAELASRSPYNTRVHKGLPPTPISNPGAAAISAAAHPARVSYLYYVAGADGCGEQVFSSSYSQFLRDAAAYQQALRRNGGNVPACRHK